MDCYRVLVISYCLVSLMVVNCVSSFFFKQKTAYDMRISDWSSDVCSSDLVVVDELHLEAADEEPRHQQPEPLVVARLVERLAEALGALFRQPLGARLRQDQRQRHDRQAHGGEHHQGEEDRKSTRLNSSH